MPQTTQPSRSFLSINTGGPICAVHDVVPAVAPHKEFVAGTLTQSLALVPDGWYVAGF